jgi:transcriptional regulator with XRE-family HTH domain
MHQQPKAVPYTAIMGHVLQGSRKQHNYNQVQIAQIMGIVQSGWAKIEKGIVPINSLQLAKFCNIIGSSPVDIQSRTERLKQDFESRGYEILWQRVPNKTAEAAGKMLIGAALSGLIFHILTRDSD